MPLFTGFMYAAVGSYMARVVRVFDIRLDGYPARWSTVALGAAIYLNFFAHHFMPDMRGALFVATAVLFGRARMHYRIIDRHRVMPLLLAFGLVAGFIWAAENVATFASIWVYPSQRAGWVPVSLGKLGSWYLLMIISVVLVTLVHRPGEPDGPPPIAEGEALPSPATR